ncbi:hypothetical protein ACPPVO_29955 [Dactylosporangium sp. McL0621]|uniref:hypothetical protein n=1 Tax=Dactylosporangium sp. McL0621 TaxID=3415678 RepID=UPI003CF3BB91
MAEIDWPISSVPAAKVCTLREMSPVAVVAAAARAAEDSAPTGRGGEQPRDADDPHGPAAGLGGVLGPGGDREPAGGDGGGHGVRRVGHDAERVDGVARRQFVGGRLGPGRALAVQPDHPGVDGHEVLEAARRPPEQGALAAGEGRPGDPGEVGAQRGDGVEELLALPDGVVERAGDAAGEVERVAGLPAGDVGGAELRLHRQAGQPHERARLGAGRALPAEAERGGAEQHAGDEDADDGEQQDAGRDTPATHVSPSTVAAVQDARPIGTAPIFLSRPAFIQSLRH